MNNNHEPDKGFEGDGLEHGSESLGESFSESQSHTEDTSEDFGGFDSQEQEDDALLGDDDYSDIDHEEMESMGFSTEGINDSDHGLDDSPEQHIEDGESSEFDSAQESPGAQDDWESNLDEEFGGDSFSDDVASADRDNKFEENEKMPNPHGDDDFYDDILTDDEEESSIGWKGWTSIIAVSLLILSGLGWAVYNASSDDNTNSGNLSVVAPSGEGEGSQDNTDPLVAPGLNSENDGDNTSGETTSGSNASDEEKASMSRELSKARAEVSDLKAKNARLEREGGNTHTTTRTTTKTEPGRDRTETRTVTRRPEPVTRTQTRTITPEPRVNVRTTTVTAPPRTETVRSRPVTETRTETKTITRNQTSTIYQRIR